MVGKFSVRGWTLVADEMSVTLKWVSTSPLMFVLLFLSIRQGAGLNVFACQKLVNFTGGEFCLG